MEGTPALIVGGIPAWLEVGPVQLIDGVLCREVLGDWSHRDEFNQIPKYIVEGATAPPERVLMPEGREPVPVRFPGKRIDALKGIHSGKVAILFNGPSLANHDLWAIKKAGIPMIGMNRTHVGHEGYNGPQPDYLCVIDAVWTMNPNVRAHPCVIDGSTGEDDTGGYRIARNFRASPFSFDLALDGYVPPLPCSTGHMALQLAVWMGFTELYCLGLDMGGGHFDGTRGSLNFAMARKYHEAQAPLLLARGIHVYVCGSPKSKCLAFPQATFEQLLEAA